MLNSLPIAPSMPASTPAASGTAAPTPADGAAKGEFSKALDEAKAPAQEPSAQSRVRGGGAAGGPDKAPRTLPGKPTFSSLPEAAEGTATDTDGRHAQVAEDKTTDTPLTELLAQWQSQAALQQPGPSAQAAGSAHGARGAAATDGKDGPQTDPLHTGGAASLRLVGSRDPRGASADSGQDPRGSTAQLQQLLASATEDRAAMAEQAALGSDATQPGVAVAPSRVPAADGGFNLGALPAAVAQATAPGSTAAAPAEARLPARPGSADFAPQLGSQLSTFVRDGIEHARLHLNPAEMGPVSVRIQLDGQTAMVHLSADNAQTRQALQESMPQLASQLREAGLTLTGGGVFEQAPRDAQAAADGQRDSRAARGANGSEAGGDEREAAAQQHPRWGQSRGVVDLVA